MIATLTRARGRGFWTVTISALAALLLLALNSGPAGAAPALTASENPVVISNGSSSKSITLSWNVAGLPPATVAVQENGGPVILYQMASSPTGSAPVTVVYGKTYTAQLTDVITGIPYVSVTITTKRPGIVIPGGPSDCQADLCILSATMEPHGTFTGFTVKTNKPAKFAIAACTTPFDAQGNCANPVSGMLGLSATSTWTSQMTGLEPNTTYHYLVQAFDPNSDDKVTKTGTFKTLRRKVEVTFASIAMTDDSDDLSACDCYFWFQAGNEAPQSYGSAAGTVSVSSGTTVHPNKTFTILNAPDSIKVRAFGLDDDTDFGQFCPYGTGAPSDWTDSGSDSCRDWASNEKTVWVSEKGPANETFTDPFQIAVNGSALKFTVAGTVKVTYVP